MVVSCCNTDRDPVSVEYDEASAYAEENGLLFMETSAKTALNVNDIFLVWNHHSYSDDTRTNSSHCDSFQAIAKKLPKDGEGGAGARRARRAAATSNPGDVILGVMFRFQHWN